MVDIISAIKAINPNAEVTINENDYDQITWHNGATVISESDIDAKKVELQAEYDAQEYARDRATEYPAITDQLDEIYHNGIDSWKAVIKVTKDKYPKG